MIDDRTKAFLQVISPALLALLTVYLLHGFMTLWLDHEPYVDPVIHFAGGAAAAYFFWRIAEWHRPGFSDFSQARSALIIISLAIAAAVTWELMEYLLFAYRGTTKWWTAINTSRDLALGFSGAAVFALINARERSSARETNKVLS
jgi:hypothetical protein